MQKFRKENGGGGKDEASIMLRYFFQQSQRNDASYEIMHTDCRLVRAFFMTKHQRAMFGAFPELIELDATYKVNRFGLPLVAITGICLFYCL